MKKKEKTSEIIISSYRKGDENAILDLYRRSFNAPKSMRYWQWRLAGTKYLGNYIDLAWSANILVGHYAVTPVFISIYDINYLTGLSGDTMTHSDYRGRGIFPKLANSVYQRMEDNGLAMVWGFPNRFSHRGFVSNLQWTDIHEVPIFRKSLVDGNSLLSSPEHIREIGTIDARFDRLWNDAKGRYAILTKRDSQYLNWRFTKNPENKYFMLGYEDDGKVLGYAVYKWWHNEVDLVDIFSVDDEVSLNLIFGVEKQARNGTADAINMWLNYTLPLHHKLEKLGFVNNGPITYFGAKVFKTVRKKSEEILNFKNWYLTLSDSDVY